MPEENKNLPDIKRQSIMNAVTADDLTKHVKLIGEIQKKVMVSKRHYGVIPGTGDKPTLLKPGAELLAMTFRLCPVYEILDKTESPELISYTIRCTLETIEDERRVATGIAACNSREKKYRYRWGDTDIPIPDTYWKSRNVAELGGPGFRVKKVDGVWLLQEKRENDNPYEEQNTIIKMAEKRAFVAAILNATAASDYFTQDIEDKVEGPVEPEGEEEPAKPAGPPSDIFTQLLTDINEAKNGDDLADIEKRHKKAIADKLLSKSENQELIERGKAKRNELNTG